jgi:hypothetical protein
MLSFLKNHPFAVEAFFEKSIVLTYAVKKEEIQAILPPCLELDCFNDQWAFVAVALVQTKNLRPKGFPVFAGNDFFLIGYRIFVRYRNKDGKSLRGLYILKSETDKKKMEWLGNIFTHYKYSTTDIEVREESAQLEIHSKKSDFILKAEITEAEINLPVQSPFQNWKEARRFAGPLPFTFSYLADKNQVLIVEGVRESWTPMPLKILEARLSFINQMHLTTAVLANAFIIRQIPYYWKKGRLESWQ